MSDTIEPGLYAEIPSAEYHSMAGVSQSMLKVLREQSPARRYREAKPHIFTPKETRS